MVLNTIQGALLALAEQEQWNATAFIKSYQACIEAGLVLEGMYREYPIASPNRQYYFALYYRVDFGSYEVYEVLYNKHKQEIGRRLCYRATVAIFVVKWGKWSADSMSFSYRFNGPKQIFTAHIEDMLAQRPRSLISFVGNTIRASANK